MNQSKWLVKQTDLSCVAQLMIETGFSRPIALLLVARGLDTKEKINSFFNPSLPSWDTQYKVLNLEKAIIRIRHAVEHKEKILVYGDRDVDGITATVIMVHTIQDLGGDVIWYVPGDEGYGLNKEVLAAYIDTVHLIISVDCGITAIPEAILCKENNIDLIITDHHEPGTELPDAYAVINPKLCLPDYPDQYLSGCGVALIIGQALMLTYSKYFNIELTFLVQTAKGMWQGQKILHYVLDGDEYVIDNLKVLKNKPVIVSSQKDAAYVRNILGYDDDNDLVTVSSLPGDSAQQWVNTKVYEHPRMKSYLNRMLVYAALGCVADMVPLTGMNRWMAKNGLRAIPYSIKPGIRVLNAFFGVESDTTLQSETLAWRYIPLLNAAGRCGKAFLAVELLLTDSVNRAHVLLEEIAGLNDKRKSLQKENTKIFEELLQEQFTPEEDKIIFLSAHNIPHGVSGIIANRFLRKHNRPVALLIERDGEIVGTMRSQGKVSALSMLEQCKDLLVKYGGHEMAAGFTLTAEKFNLFRERIFNIASTEISVDDLVPAIEVDAEIETDWIDQAVLKELEFLDPFGMGWEKPIFFLKNQHLKYFQMLGTTGDYAKMKIGKGEHTFDIISWDIGSYIEEFKNNRFWDIIVKLEVNSFKGKKTVRFNLIDMKPALVEMVV